MNTEKTEVAESRKTSHIELTFKSQVEKLDDRFYYEPMLSGHPSGELEPVDFCGKQMAYPIWVSSMTGGADLAGQINKNLAEAVAKYGLGMGLGSCRQLLDSDKFFDDFNLRPILGSQVPLFANIGIAQVEQLIKLGELKRLEDMVGKLDADGIFLHVNPLQEWMQPEGDIYHISPLEAVNQMLEETSLNIIVKEVGQGFGYESLKELFKLPLAGIDFAAHGGTNFSQIELHRNTEEANELMSPMVFVGHTANEMVELTNRVVDELGSQRMCNQVIISGGIKNYLDGYYLTEKINVPAIYGQASKFLKAALESPEYLDRYVQGQIEGLKIANALLRIKR
ncbi:MAG: isopentenyl-diphosphate delta-isomerase [Crocinitomicaceae bacterium]|nr:isopentenyl-diphosphate delta-isomerase [Crocinitomicaceae bacterium]